MSSDESSSQEQESNSEQEKESKSKENNEANSVTNESTERIKGKDNKFKFPLNDNFFIKFNNRMERK